MIIRKNDLVCVMSGASKSAKKGKDVPRHRVLFTFPDEDRIIVEGVNQIWKHVRRSDKNPTGGRVQKEAPIHVSNVALWCDKCERPVKACREVVDGKRVRVCKKCREPILPRGKRRK